MKYHKLVLYPAFALMIIGLFEMVVLGPSSGYWAIMLAVALFFYYIMKKPKD